MASIATLSVQLTAITAPFSRGMKSATTPIRMFGNAINSVNSKFAGFIAGLASAATITAGVRFVKTQMDAADALGKTSDQLGINVQKLKAYEIGARKSGLEQETLVSGLARFGKLISESGLGVGIDEGLRLAADEIMGLKDETDRLRASAELFGRNAGRKFLSFLEDGSAGLDAMIRDADRLGGTLNRIDIAEIEAANDAWEDISIALENLAGIVGLKVAPFVTDLSTRFAEATASGTKFGDQVTTALRYTAYGLHYAKQGWNVLMLGIKINQATLLAFGEAGAKVFSILIKGVNALSKQLNKLLPESKQIPEISTDWLDAFTQGIDDQIKDINEEIKGIEFDWSTKGVDEWFDNVIAKSREAAEARVADNNVAGESLAKSLKVDDQKFAQVTRLGVANYLRNVARGTQINGHRVTGPNGARVQSVRDPQLVTTNRLLNRIAENTEDNTAVAA